MPGAPRTKTQWPGIYRRGDAVQYVWRDAQGRQRSATASTIKEARAEKAAREREAAGGVAHHRGTTFEEYARAWVDGYQGKGGGKGFRSRTRDDYRRDLERYAIPFLGRRKLVDLQRPHLREWVAWLADDDAQAKRHEQENERRRLHNATADPGDRLAIVGQGGALKDATIRRIGAVVSAVLNTAALDRAIPSNPAQGLVFPRRDVVRGDAGAGDVDGEAKALTRAELAAFLQVCPAAWRPFFLLLAGSGLRVSEALGLATPHLQLDGERPVVRVRRALGRDGLDLPKSKHGTRDVPIAWSVADALRGHLPGRAGQTKAQAREWGDLVFRTTAGTPHLQENVRRRVLEPTAAEAGVSWAGFHAFRHTFASLHVEAGTNIVRLSRLLGHHSPAFTLNTYAHLLDDGLGDPLDLDAELRRGGSMGAAERTGTDGNADDAIDRILSS